MGCVYVWTNQVNGKQYVGMSINPEDRKKSHLSSIRSGKGCYSFHNAVRKHGVEAFTYEEVFWSDDRAELAAREIEEIARRGTFKDSSKGYNLTPGGEGATALTPETEARRAAKIKVTLNRPELKAKMSANAKAVSARPGVREKRSAVMQAHNARPEVKADLSERFKAKNAEPAFRAKQKAAYERPEVREKLAANSKAYWAKPEARAKQSAAQKARMSCPEERAKAVAILRAARETPKAKANLAAAQKARWENPEARAKQSALLAVYNAKPGVRERRSEMQKAICARPGHNEKRSAAQRATFARPEVKARLSARSTAANLARNPNIFAEGLTFISQQLAAEHFGIGQGGVHSRVYSRSFRFWHTIPNHNDPECDAVEECWAIMQWATENRDHANVPEWMRERLGLPRHGEVPSGLWAAEGRVSTSSRGGAHSPSDRQGG